MITGKINGKYQITELHISQDLMDDKDMLEDLMMIAINQGISQVEKEKEENSVQSRIPRHVAEFW